jgi:hypothetical protein
MTIKRTAVCIASCRPDAFKKWHKEWKNLFDKHKVNVYVSWDSEDNVPKVKGNTTFIKRKDFPDFVPTHTSACRSAAVRQAYKDGYDMYIFLDDDVYPPKDGNDPIQAYIDGFNGNVFNPGYFNVGFEFLHPKAFTRGFPYKERQISPVVAQYGGWDNVPDLDARDTVDMEQEIYDGFSFERDINVVPKHQGFTGCFMNCAFRHEVVPALYHLYQGTNRCGYDRFDDIWASLILKRLCDHFNWSITINGYATCYHDRMSNPVKSVLQEQHGHTFNEDLWDKLLRFSIDEESTFYQCYSYLTTLLPDTQSEKAYQWIKSL